jgi:hypothetical protein
MTARGAATPVRPSTSSPARWQRHPKADKLLWVLRPQTGCPWDVAIAKAGGQGSQRDGYANHLRKAREWARRITNEAAVRGIDNVPAHVGRPQSSLVRIYDEWCYMTFTRGSRI